jgi:hypothetical protein
MWRVYIDHCVGNTPADFGVQLSAHLSNIIYPYAISMGGMAQSVYRLAMGWTVRGSNSVVGEIFRTRPDRPWGPPSLLYNGYWVYPGGKAAGRGVALITHPI